LISARVLKKSAPEGTWLFSAENGRRFSASLPLGLSPKVGESLRFAVDARADGTVFYRLADAASASRAEALRMEAIRSLGLVPDRLSFLLVSVSRAFGIKVDAQRILRLRSLVERAVAGGGLDDSDASFFAVLADDKGLAPSPEAIRAAAFAADPGSPFRDKPRKEHPRRDPPGAEALSEAAREMQPSGNPLAFMNALDGRSGKRWLLFPFDFARGSVEIKATLRLLLNQSTVDPARMVESFALSVSAPERFWSFEAAPFSRTLVVRVDPMPQSGSVLLRRRFSEAFAPLGLSVEFDGLAPSRRIFDSDGMDPPSVRTEA